MRNFLLGTALSALATAAMAAPPDYYQPRASLYLSYAFDRPAAAANAPDSAALRYGFALNRTAPGWQPDTQALDARHKPLLQWEFSRLAFDNFSIAGQPMFDREMILRQNGDGGGVFGYVKDNFGSIVLITSGAILAAYIVDADKDSRNRDPSDPDGIGTDNSEDTPLVGGGTADGGGGGGTGDNGGTGGTGGGNGGNGGGGGGLPDLGGGLGGILGQ